MMRVWFSIDVLGYLSTVALILYMLHTHGETLFWTVFYKMESVNEVGVSSLVKDIRGDEPYLTMKMKCFYCEDEDYGPKWSSIMKNKPCQDILFTTCFANRSVAGRRETHVLTLIRRCDVRSCFCTDPSGWCKLDKCSQLPDIKCCLDRGKDAVMCRK